MFLPGGADRPSSTRRPCGHPEPPTEPLGLPLAGLVRRPTRSAVPGAAGPGRAGWVRSGGEEADGDTGNDGTSDDTGNDGTSDDTGDDGTGDDGTGDDGTGDGSPSSDAPVVDAGSDRGAGHRHAHGHEHAPAGRRIRLLLAVLLLPCAVAAVGGLVLLRPVGGAPATAGAPLRPVRGEVVAARAADCSPGDGRAACAALVVHLTDGPRAGRDLVQLVPVEPGTPRFGVGDPVVLGWSGGDPDDPTSYQVVDFQRGDALVWLAALFAAAVLLLGRWRGLAALAALGVGFAVLLVFVLPAILSGRSPLAVAVVGSGVIMFAVLYLTHGLSARTSTAVLGTLASLVLIGLLGAGFSVAARLTGLDDQTNALIASLGTGVDARGLLLAGMVIGALGVLDDVTVTQTSAVWELRAANPRLGAPALFRAAMRIGRDHVASSVNTLVLAYAGAALPLLLVFHLSGRSLQDVATSNDVAMEIVRTLVGSIGLVASVPVTTALAALVASREDPAVSRPARGRARSPRRRSRGTGARPGPGTPPAARPVGRGTDPPPRRPATAR